MKRKKHKKRKVWPIILVVLTVLIVMAAAAVFLFRTRSYKVEGNSYYGERTITTWIENDPLSVNSLYVLYKYNFTDADLPSGVESLSISLKDPWTVKVKVKEKEMAGYVDYDGAYLYFDRTGTAVLRTKKIIEGVPHIEGLMFDSAKAKIGKKLPVEDDSIFEKIVEENNKQECVKVLAFTNKVPELMSISDLVISKPGGLTTSESLASNLPMIIINPIPGQEEENAEFLESKGTGIWLRKDDSSFEVLKSVIDSPTKLDEMKKNTEILAKKHSTEDICNILLSF